MATKKKTPRGQVPSLIGGSNGRPKQVEVKRSCFCYRCNSTISAGTKCIEIPKLGTGFASARRVCDDCFQAIVEKTYKDLQEIQGFLATKAQ